MIYKAKFKWLIVVFFLILLGCAIHIGPTPQPSPCQIENLMLDETIFRGDIRQTGPASKEGAPMRFGINKLGVGFTSMTQGGATQDVYEGKSIEQTKNKFTESVKFEFSSQEDYTEWYIPDTFNYQSPAADQFRFGCRTHITSSVENCRAFGQYNVYLIVLDVDISSLLTYEDMKRMLQVIDTKVAQCLANQK